MADITFIYPCMGRFTDTKYVKSWQMQPLSIAVLSGLTPADWTKTFFDDRLEDINYNRPTDLVAISVETYNSKRAYQIAAEYRQQNIPVIMGGFHPTFCPEETLEHANAICIGEAEPIWQQVLEDFSAGNLQQIYQGQAPETISTVFDRSIFSGKKYLDIELVEYGRGCKFKCNFCSITAFHNATYKQRNLDDIICELKKLKGENIFFVDDNIVADIPRLKHMLRAIIPLKLTWVSQGSINMASDNELLELMVQSGCAGVLIGFESLDHTNMKLMNKGVNQIDGFPTALDKLRKAGLRIYGTFIFGYPNDSDELVKQTLKFSRQQKLFMAAFNHLVIFPGTKLYEQVNSSGNLTNPKWWLDENYRFGDVVYQPESSFSAEKIEQTCMELRRKYYSLPSILKRSLDFKANCRTFKSAVTYWGLNLMLKREIDQKFGLPLGLRNHNQAKRN